MGPDWRNIFEFVIVSADKPNFYTDNARPFREVSISSGRVEFTEVSYGATLRYRALLNIVL